MYWTFFKTAFLVTTLLQGASHALTIDTIRIDLDISRTAMDPFWQRFGTNDSRTFSLLVRSDEQRFLGTVTSPPYKYPLVSKQSIGRYLADGTVALLLNAGVKMTTPADFEMTVVPRRMKISSYDGKKNGIKTAQVVLDILLKKKNGPIQWVARVSNDGFKACTDNSETDYLTLMNSSLAGAMTKLWASRILYADSILGKGRIEKTDLGTYAFIPDSLPPLSLTDTIPIVRPVVEMVPDSTPAAPHIGQTASPKSPHTQKQEKPEISLSSIPVAVLPFENASGDQRFDKELAAMRDQCLLIFARAKTVHLFEREKLAVLLHEQALGQSGLISDSTAVKVGNISGVKIMVAGRLSISGSYYMLSLRMINVETSSVVATAQARINDATALSETIPVAVASLLKNFSGEAIEVNRNSMPYPSIAPLAIPAHTCGSEDGASLELNPACLMRVQRRDAQFFVSLGEVFKGTVHSSGADRTFKTIQPPYAHIGLNLALPLSSRIATGIGIRHDYTFASIRTDAIKSKEEETVITLPFALGINPHLSVGVNTRMHIIEYQLQNGPADFHSGMALTYDMLLGVMYKVAPGFKLGMTLRPHGLTSGSQEKRSPSGEFSDIVRTSPARLRLGTAMYPREWFFFFADLEYARFHDYPKLQPGFHLGMQLTYKGKVVNSERAPVHGMIPLYAGYSHQPYDRTTHTQGRYFSVGSGYFLNNFYVQWSMRYNVEPAGERTYAAGLAHSYTLAEGYTLATPLFLTFGYRF